MARGIYRTIDKVVPIWFEFGTYPNGNKDISDGNDDSLIENISEDNMKKIVSERNKMRSIITELAEKLCAKTSFEEVDNILESYNE